jgi:hypothetical protein
LAAKPPKTTEWTALANTELAIDGGQRLHVGEQCRIGNALDPTGDRTVVDEGNLFSAPCFDMTVQTVVAGIR